MKKKNSLWIAGAVIAAGTLFVVTYGLSSAAYKTIPPTLRVPTPPINDIRQVTKPDLVVTDIRTPLSSDGAYPWIITDHGDQAWFVSVKNKNPNSTCTANLKVQLEGITRSGIRYVAEVPLGNQPTISQADCGKTQGAVQAFYFPQDKIQFFTQVIATVDSLNEINESNEENNKLISKGYMSWKQTSASAQ